MPQCKCTYGISCFYTLTAKARFPDLLLGGGDIIRHAAEFNCVFIRVVNRISRFGIEVPRLPYSTGIHKILFAGLHSELCVGAASDHGIADEGDRHMRMPEETNPGVLTGESGSRSHSVKGVSPHFRKIESRVD